MRGRTRIALLTSSTAPLAKLDHLYRAAAARQMRAQEPWVQGVSLQEPHWARNAVRAMFAGRPADRPDGLIVSDEHLVEFALAGLNDQGLRLPRDVEVVGHANFHVTPPGPSPVRRLGYVTGNLLREAIDMIDRANRDRAAAKRTVLVDPSFESELEQPADAPALRGDARPH
ncbi:MAG: substrate-binding domain-containing protein [Planctomycetota bacterium]|nr:substrate-binding domain-containing protein [Planctomycetota bacterium]